MRQAFGLLPGRQRLPAQFPEMLRDLRDTGNLLPSERNVHQRVPGRSDMLQATRRPCHQHLLLY